MPARKPNFTTPGLTKGRRALATALLYTALIVIGGLMLAPFFVLVSTSLMSAVEANNPRQWLPNELQWANFPLALERMGFLRACANTIVISAVAVIAQLLMCSLVGLGFARYRFRGRGTLFAVMLATMMVPPQVTMIPVFILFRSVNLIDTFVPLVLNSLIASPFFIFLFRQFYRQIPESVIEAARLDGASPLAIYWRIMLPLSKPVAAVVAIQTFMFTWNDFLGPLIYLNSPDNQTLALALNAFISQYGIEQRHLLMAASLVMLMPCVAVILIGQRYLLDPFAYGEDPA